MQKELKIEDIYPLTITVMKHGKIAFVQASPYFDCVTSLCEDEEVQYEPHEFMSKWHKDINYGIGDTIELAFEDYKSRL